MFFFKFYLKKNTFALFVNLLYVLKITDVSHSVYVGHTDKTHKKFLHLR